MGIYLGSSEVSQPPSYIVTDRNQQCVDDVKEGKSQCYQAKLLSAEHPVVKPVWEPPVFRSPVELQNGSNDAGEVNHSKQRQGRYGKDTVWDGNSDAKCVILFFIHIRVDYVSDNTVDKQEDTQDGREVEGELPHGKQLQGVIFNFTGCQERSLVQRSQPKSTHYIHHSLLGFAVISADEHLGEK